MQFWPIVVVLVCSFTVTSGLTSSLLVKGQPLPKQNQIPHIAVQGIHPMLSKKNHVKNLMNPTNHIDGNDKDAYLHFITPVVAQASSNMHKTMTHTSVKHLTAGDAKVAVITKTTEHSHSNIMHPKGDHQVLKGRHPNKIEDLTAKVVFAITPHTSSVESTYLPLVTVVDTGKVHLPQNHLPLYVTSAFSHDNLIDLREHKSEIDHNVVHQNMDISRVSHDIGANMGNHLWEADNKHMVNQVTGFAMDANMNRRKVISEHEIKHNNVFDDYEANAYRNPIGGFGAGLKFGGHGAGHGYFGFHGR